MDVAGGDLIRQLLAVVVVVGLAGAVVWKLRGGALAGRTNDPVWHRRVVWRSPLRTRFTWSKSMAGNSWSRRILRAARLYPRRPAYEAAALSSGGTRDCRPDRFPARRHAGGRQVGTVTGRADADYPAADATHDAPGDPDVGNAILADRRRTALSPAGAGYADPPRRIRFSSGWRSFFRSSSYSQWELN